MSNQEKGWARTQLLVGLVVGVALLAGSLVPGRATARSKQPDIVLVLTDDQRWDTLRYMPAVRRRLVARGIRFSNAFVVNPLCCPSRAAVLTGQYSHSTRVYSNSRKRGLRNFRDNETSTIATWLDEAGYRTAFIGKYLNRYDGTYIPPGWDRWVAAKVLGETGGGYFDYTLNVDGVLRHHGRRPRQYSTDVLGAAAASFIRHTPSRRPLFLLFAPHAPHGPATPAPRHEGLLAGVPSWRPPSYNEADVSDKPSFLQARRRWSPRRRASMDEFRLNQLRSLLAVDDAVRRIVKALAATRRLRNTLLVFSSDNGYLWGEHRLGAKRYSYEESIRVPLVVRYDRLVARPRADARLVANIDLAPTFAALAGVSAPGAEGKNLLPLLSSETGSWRKRFLVESSTSTVPPYCELRARRHTYTVYGSGERELYDLQQDPDQLQNVVGERASASLVSRFRTPLARLCNPPPRGVSRRLLCTIEGTARGDRLAGTRRYDILCPGRGGDVVAAGRGADWVYAAYGDDVVQGGPGDDRVYLGPGRDRASTGAGADRVFARDGAPDRVRCRPGLDRVVADRVDVVAADCETVRRR